VGHGLNSLLLGFARARRAAEILGVRASRHVASIQITPLGNKSRRQSRARLRRAVLAYVTPVAAAIADDVSVREKIRRTPAPAGKPLPWRRCVSITCPISLSSLGLSTYVPCYIHWSMGPKWQYEYKNVNCSLRYYIIDGVFFISPASLLLVLRVTRTGRDTTPR
jgi:hypothetical protein